MLFNVANLDGHKLVDYINSEIQRLVAKDIHPADMVVMISVCPVLEHKEEVLYLETNNE